MGNVFERVAAATELDTTGSKNKLYNGVLGAARWASECVCVSVRYSQSGGC